MSPRSCVLDGPLCVVRCLDSSFSYVFCRKGTATFRSLFRSIVEKRFSVPAPYRAEREQIMFLFLLLAMEKRILCGCEMRQIHRSDGRHIIESHVYARVLFYYT